ncbi:glutaminase [Labrys monachus]|uniref:Glutaminase n=2 Tax=Labrys monachus TaxID=217067 RepID=A0ABU0FQ30_9HYPH|nr:glutaminase [Labrys monachus]
MSMNIAPPDHRDELQFILDDVYRRGLDQRDGALADYIPELARVEPESFGIAIATAKGKVYAVGDAEVAFTIQSVSKAFGYCLAIEQIGRAQVLQRVGVEPSGDAFNAIEFDPHTRRPYNPMVNAGAITVAGILHDRFGDGAFDFMMDRFSRAAGRPLGFDEKVYRSESETGHRNRAIAHLLLAGGIISEAVEAIVDLYFRQCSILVTAVDLARMGATLANMGENPMTGDQVFELQAVRDTQAVMFSCGMYDYSGNWIYDIGIPAKSGVGGGIVGVVNRQLGIGTYSPRLDRKGNSVRGVAAVAALSDELGLHAFDCTNVGSSLLGRFIT